MSPSLLLDNGASLPIGRWITKNVEPDRLHAVFLIHFALQLANAFMRHSSRHLIYIFLLHGPVLFIIVLLNSLVHAHFSTKWFQRKPSPTCLCLTGTTDLPKTDNLAEEFKLGLLSSITHGILAILFTIKYAIFDRFAFDKTLSEGVDEDELEASFRGLIANVCAQAVWINVMLVGIHLLLPAYPSSAALLFASSEKCSKYSRIWIDAYAALAAAVLTLVGIAQTIWDDDTGIGLFMLCIFPTQCIRSILRALGGESHPLWSRPCYRLSPDGAEAKEDQIESSSSPTTMSLENQDNSSASQEDIENKTDVL